MNSGILATWSLIHTHFEDIVLHVLYTDSQLYAQRGHND